MDSLMIGVWMSNVCHRHCEGCYSNPLCSEDKMSPVVATDVAHWLAKIAAEEVVRNLQISFLGGEPLNNSDVMFRLMDTLNSNLNTAIHKSYFGSGVRYVLFTNGDLLTTEILDGLKSREVVVKLNPTYDSLEDIERKILMVKKVLRGCSLPIALNSFNLDRLEDLTKLAVKHHCHLRTNRLYHGGTIPGYVDEYKKQMTKMFDLLLRSDWVMWPNWIMESTLPTYPGPKNPCLCGKRYGVIATDGSIQGCNPDKDTKVGSIYTTEHWGDLKFPQRWSAKNLPECQGCKYMTWCQGGCPYTRKLAYGTYNKKSPFCSAFKELFPMLMDLKWRYEYVKCFVDSPEDLAQTKEMFCKGVI